jgi:hypothetical protein
MEGKIEDGRCSVQKEALFLSSHPASHPTGIEPLTPATHIKRTTNYTTTHTHTRSECSLVLCTTHGENMSCLEFDERHFGYLARKFGCG